MARETKVGVITGLAFIICFAIVLANRGTSRTEPTVAHHRARSVHGASTSDLHSPAAQPSWSADGGGRVSPTSNPAANPQGSSPSVWMQPSTSAAAGYVDTVRPAVNSNGEPGSAWLVDTSHAPVLQAPDSRVTHTGQVNAPVSLPGFIPAQVPPGVMPVRGRENPTVPASLPSSGVRTEAVRYVVAPGETLWSLAARAYGKKSGTLVQAIYDANRSVLSSPDSIKAGMELELPTVPGFGSPAGAARLARGRANEVASPVSPPASKPSLAAREVGRMRPNDAGTGPRAAAGSKATPNARARASEGSSGPVEYRWYNVRKNDRLMGIAREQLGDAGRWEEIHALNKDKFPDPEKIREGVRIKLPVSRLESRRNQGT